MPTARLTWTRALLVWLLVGWLPAQAVAAAWLASAGPAHMHAVVAAASVRASVAKKEPTAALVDFRRAVPALEAQHLAHHENVHEHQHQHQHAGTERHHHPADAAQSPSRDAFTGLDAAGDETGTASSAGTSFLLALSHVVPSWHDGGSVGHALAGRAGWAATSAIVALPDRPPR